MKQLPEKTELFKIANDEFIRLLYPKVVRTIKEFSEQEVVIPKGPRKGVYYDSTFMPFYDFVFDAICDNYWRKLAIVGPTQAGKSLVCNNIPMLYVLFELEEDVIVGIPDMEMARGIWTEKIMPVIAETRYKTLLPTTGAGARGGVPTAIALKNGTFLRFMGAGGGDAQRSSHTARVIIMTEVDKMDDVGEASEEADPVSQIEMRADAFADTSKIILECTVTHEQGRIWQEAMVTGSGGRIFVPCGLCGAYQVLEPHGLVFDPQDMVTAEESARYRCSICEGLWDDAMRREALQHPVLVHKGQDIDENGNVIGELPRTRTFGLHYNVLYSPMQSIGKTAAQQWEADTSDLKEKKKAMMQSKWAVPWSEDAVVGNVLSYSFLRQRSMRSKVTMKTVPDWHDFTIMEIDVQKRWMYWHLDAYRRDGTSQVVEYGIMDIINDSDRAILKALDGIADIGNEGWPLESDPDTIIQPRLFLLDTGYRYDVIAPFLTNREKWFGVKGVGRGMRSKVTGAKAIFAIPGIMQVRVQPDGNKIWFIEVDETKSLVHDRFFLEPGQPGYTELPNDVTQGYMMSLTAEKREYSTKDEGYTWVKVRRRNDYLDCRSYGVAGAMYLAQRMKRDDEKLNERVEANKRMSSEEHGSVYDQIHKERTQHVVTERRPITAKRAPYVRSPWLDSSGRYFD